MKYYLVILSFAALLFTSGCLHDQFEPNLVEGCDTTYYQREIHPLLVNNCAKSGCHDGTTGKGNYALYEDVKNAVEITDHGESDLLHRVKLPPSDPDHMPNDGTSLNQHQIDELSFWIKNGYQGCDR